MSCNGCRVLRKGCSDNCVLRQCLHSIDTPQAQSNATVFVAKFFGRAGLMSFISNVPPFQRPSLFQSLLYEAVGRTINPVSGAVGLLWTGNWGLCQAAVETVLCGGELKPLPDCLGGVPELDDVSESAVNVVSGKPKPLKRKEDGFGDDISRDVDLNLTASMPYRAVIRRATTPSEESETTTSLVSGLENSSNNIDGGEKKLLRLFF